MSKASDKARAGFGATLAAGLQTRGKGAQLPAQAAADAAAVAAVDLTPQERLADLERRIEASVGQYQSSVRQLQIRHRRELGELLEEIRRDELFSSAGFDSFGHYTKARFGWKRAHVYRLMDMAMVGRALSPLGQGAVDGIPESWARPLAKVARREGDGATRNLLQLVQEEAAASGKRVTAALLDSRRKELQLGGVSPIGDEPDVSPIGDTDDDVIDAEVVEDEREGINQMLRAAAEAAERSLQLLDKAAFKEMAPYDVEEAAVDLSRIRSASVRLGRRANARFPGL